MPDEKQPVMGSHSQRRREAFEAQCAKLDLIEMFGPSHVTRYRLVIFGLTIASFERVTSLTERNPLWTVGQPQRNYTPPPPPSPNN